MTKQEHFLQLQFVYSHISAATRKIPSSTKELTDSSWRPDLIVWYEPNEKLSEVLKLFDQPVPGEITKKDNVIITDSDDSGKTPMMPSPGWCPHQPGEGGCELKKTGEL